MKMTEFIKILTDVGYPVRHYNTKSYNDMPYICYTEYYEKYNKADNRINETITSIQVDLFTAKNDKSAKKKVKKALDDNEIVFEITTMVENDEKNEANSYVHHIFDCEVVIDD